MNKYLLGLVFLLFIFSSCSKDEDLASGLSGYWKQVAAYDNGELCSTDKEENLSILFEANGVYRMFDPCLEKEHAGTWLVTDKDWLNMSMDKIAGKNSSDNSYRYTQVLVRFTITHLEGNEMELRIKTFLGERKKTVMVSQMEQDPPPATPEEAMELDKKNKELHTYTYQFRRIH